MLCPAKSTQAGTPARSRSRWSRTAQPSRLQQPTGSRTSRPFRGSIRCVSRGRPCLAAGNVAPSPAASTRTPAAGRPRHRRRLEQRAPLPPGTPIATIRDWQESTQRHFRGSGCTAPARGTRRGRRRHLPLGRPPSCPLGVAALPTPRLGSPLRRSAAAPDRAGRRARGPRRLARRRSQAQDHQQPRRRARAPLAPARRPPRPNTHR